MHASGFGSYISLNNDADPETSRASDRPEDLVYVTAGQESIAAVDSFLSELEDWWK